MKKPPYKPIYKNVTVRMVDGSVIEGRINIASKQRVSEMFTSHESPFITLTEVISTQGVSGNIILNKTHIVWVGLKD